MERYVCVHGHFYQPPRENPWLEEVELQDSAAPYHDWNERINAECYAPNSASRILDNDRRIIDIVNSYSRISFNFGPTLLAWMERHAPEVYHAILDADSASRQSFSGHGSAMAQCYSHMIMPLANAADKRTQVIWGLRDFTRRFGRDAEGMWLPETAVDLETLDLMAAEGIRFTILAQHQASRVRKIGETPWHDITEGNIDPKIPYLCRLPSGRTIVLFFFDGPISQKLAFGRLLEHGENFARQLASAFVKDRPSPQLVHVASDGETYGHHHRFGDMALAYCLYYLEAQGLAKLTVYGEYLERFPPPFEVEIHENSSWSCVHGIERWRRDCGCQSGLHHGWHQQWRAPLRNALDGLRDRLARIYEEQASALLGLPRAARDEYINVIIDRTPENIDCFLSEHRKKELTPDESVKVLKLLEMQRQAMSMYTSCGWFFDEITGIETVQILNYAARAIQLARETSGSDPEEEFVADLKRAPGNLTDFEDGAKVYEQLVQPAVVDLLRVGVHYGVSSLFEEYPRETTVYSYTAERRAYERFESGRQTLVLGRVGVHSNITREASDVSFSVLHFGDHNLIAAARGFMGDEAFQHMKQDLAGTFETGDLAQITRFFEIHFTRQKFSLWHLFRDEQRKILSRIFESAMRETDNAFRQLYDHQSAILQGADKFQSPLPKPLAAVAERILTLDILDSLDSPAVVDQKFSKAVDLIKRLHLEIDGPALSYIASQKVGEMMRLLAENPRDIGLLETIIALLRAASGLSLDLNLWQAQNIYFTIGRKIQPRLRDEISAQEERDREWQRQFFNLGDLLRIHIAS